MLKIVKYPFSVFLPLPKFFTHPKHISSILKSIIGPKPVKLHRLEGLLLQRLLSESIKPIRGLFRLEGIRSGRRKGGCLEWIWT